MGVSYQVIAPVRKGTSQIGRLSNKLLPHYFRVDERTVNDFLAFTAKYSKYVPFVNENNMMQDPDPVNGNWKKFFEKDISLLLASIISTDIEEIDSRFESHVRSVQNSVKVKDRENAFSDLFKYLVSISGLFYDWKRQSRRAAVIGGDLENKVMMELFRVVDQNMQLPTLKLLGMSLSADRYGVLGKIARLDFAEMIPEWTTTETQESINTFMGTSTDDKLNQSISNALLECRIIYRSFFNGLAYVVNRFKRYFEDSIENKDDHKPDIGLFIVFLKLYRYIQDELNTLTERHLDFYYQEILQQGPKPSISDQVHLLVRLSRNTNSFRIPAGTQFLAGRDEFGNEIHFRMDDEVEINKTEVESLRSVFISSILESQTWTYKLVTGLYHANVANSADGFGQAFHEGPKDWPIFGEEQYKGGRQTMLPADIGFAVSSPMFFLGEGNREVKLTFNFRPDSVDIFKKLIEDIVTENTEEGYRYAFFEVFSKGRDAGFQIYVSAEEGWINISDIAPNTVYIESKPWKWERFSVGFTIPASAPSVTPVNSATIKEEFHSAYPVIKFVLNSHKSPYVYTFLETLVLDSLDIEVSVDRLRTVNVCNDLSRLDATQPFQAFGPSPNIGSYFLVGNHELFSKKLTELEFKVEWHNLPENSFADYYDGYFKNKEDAVHEEMFKVRLSALSGNEFKPAEPNSELVFPLFKPQKGNRNSIRMKVPRPEVLDILVDPELDRISDYNMKSSIGYFKFELIEPEMAFGHSLFQEKMMDAAKHNADMNNEEKVKYPNSPFSPMVRTVSIAYKATDTTQVEASDFLSPTQIYHIHPFGVAPIFSAGEAKMENVVLVPEFREDGYLFIGLRDLRPPQELSLLFQLVAGKSTKPENMPEIKWSYLSDDVWMPLSDTAWLSDTTDKFTTTGIVRIQIPGNITKWNQLLPSGLYWLRLSIKGDIENVSRAIDVKTQAVRAVWVDNGNSDRLRKPLKPWTISNLSRRKAEILEVVQPFPSFGGQAGESIEEYRQRVSERLRHKGRAVTHWDFERLVLQQFHTIFQTKAITHISDPKFVDPGEVRVVVVPGHNYGTEALTPKVNHHMLITIRDYLAKLASPFSKIKVTNPAYEYLRVNCAIMFTAGNSNGQSMEKLKLAIRDYLCPWFNDPKQEFNIGGSVNIDNLLRFIESLPYVKFVTKFSIFHFYVDNEETGEYSLRSTADPGLDKDSREELRATKPWAVLIPDMDHEFEIIDRERNIPAQFSLRPVDFQRRFQITPQLIKIKLRKEIEEKTRKTIWEENDNMKVFI